MLIFGAGRLTDAVERAVRGVLANTASAGTEWLNAATSVLDLKKQISQLEIDKAKQHETWDRGNRELEHKIGLERKRQEFELIQCKREVTVQVQEENLKADKERFKSEMDFQRKRLEQEVGSLRTLVGQMMERLPSAEIFMEVGKKK